MSLTIFSCQQESLVLVKEGRSDYEIVYTSTKENNHLEAGKLLQEYLEKSTGVRLPLRPKVSNENHSKLIVVGPSDSVPEHSETIVIRSAEEKLHLYGGSVKATKNAVYTFLQDFLGFRWYAPNATEIPKSKTLTLKAIAYSYTPEIVTRTVHAKLFYDNHDFADAQKVTYEPFPYYVPEARVHTFHRFLPEEDYYKTHPEYYALRGTQRLPTQLCLTNPDVLELVKTKVGQLFEAHPDAAVISVSQDDNQQYCQCEHCAKIDAEEGSPAGTMIRFVNKIAADFPDKMISTLAYQYTRQPPKTKPLDNVLITLCSIECDRSSPIAEKCIDFSNDLIGWSALTDNVRIWDYTTQFTNFLAPFPNLHTLQPNLQLFRDNNAKWVFEQHSNNPSELFELRAYVTAQLLWNPDQDFELLLKDFIEGYYKEASPFVTEYVNTIHEEIQQKKDFFLFLYGDPSQAFSDYLRPELLDRYSALFDEAEMAVAQQPQILKRVKTARLGVNYAVLEACRKNLAPGFQLLDENGQGEKIIAARVKNLLQTFEQTTVDNKIYMMNEMGFTVEEYLQNYRMAITTASKPNIAIGKTVTTLTKPKKYANENPLVLTDGALGGSSFYANWLGYEGNDLEVVVDLGAPIDVETIDLSFLQVTNHIVFFPKKVQYQGSVDGKTFIDLATVANIDPLQKKSKVNDIQNFGAAFTQQKLRYIKVKAQNTPTPYWHHAAGLPSWVFADEIIVN